MTPRSGHNYEPSSRTISDPRVLSSVGYLKWVSCYKVVTMREMVGWISMVVASVVMVDAAGNEIN
ncbi:hypothetical protein HanRHA438_Chr04g0191371 [Helianthus annuus]|nr:hypothetical protein HanIR_Chr04g0195421 [Helianthus annuus]KAJ0928201.1 hypothetical protein HanRHA438_Chr04g0191371 [Helianthus annuus]